MLLNIGRFALAMFLLVMLTACFPQEKGTRRLTDYPLDVVVDSGGVSCYVYRGYGISCVKVR